MLTVPFPSTPAQVRECLSQASEGAIAVERNGEPKVVIMPAEEYAQLIGLDQAGLGSGKIALADEDRCRLADLEAQAERVGRHLSGSTPDHDALFHDEDGLPS